MTQTWLPCPAGYALYCEMCDEDAENPDALFTLAWRPRWWAWEEHKRDCKECRLEKDTK